MYPIIGICEIIGIILVKSVILCIRPRLRLVDLKVRRSFIFTASWSNYCHIKLIEFMILFIRLRPHCGFESTAFVHFHRLRLSDYCHIIFVKL